MNPQTVIRGGYGILFETGASEVSNLLGTSIYDTSAAVDYTVNHVTLGVLPDAPVLTLSSIFPTPRATTPGSFTVSTGPGEGYPGDGLYTIETYSDQKSTPLPYYERMVLDAQREVGPDDLVTGPIEVRRDAEDQGDEYQSSHF